MAHIVACSDCHDGLVTVSLYHDGEIIRAESVPYPEGDSAELSEVFEEWRQLSISGDSRYTFDS